MKEELDQYFTPTALANELAAAVTIKTAPEIVGDFAAGDGELLRAIEKRWKSVACIAIDIDDVVVSKLKFNHPHWMVNTCDFLNEESRNSVDNLFANIGKFSVILLNPPFSCRGGTKYSVSIGEKRIFCSPAFAFVIEATKFLDKGGQLVALIPSNLMHSEKDAVAREELTKNYGLELVSHYPRGAFTSCTPRTSIIRLTPSSPSYDLKENIHNDRFSIISEKITQPKVSIFRGRVPMGKSVSNSMNSFPLIHTTELQLYKLLPPNKFAESTNATVTGPAVLLPRVGKPTQSKIVVLANGSPPVVLSDCLFAIECETSETAEYLSTILIRSWEKLESMYFGTCARYLTIKSLAYVLKQSGFAVTPYGVRVEKNACISTKIGFANSYSEEKLEMQVA